MNLGQIIISAVLFCMGFSCVAFALLVLRKLRTATEGLMVVASTVSAIFLVWASVQAFPTQQARVEFAAQASPCARP